MATTLLTPCAVSRIAWTRIGLGDLMTRLQQRKILIDEMNVPRPLDLRDHHHVELVADFGDDAGEIVEEPGRVQRIDAHP